MKIIFKVEFLRPPSAAIVFVVARFVADSLPVCIPGDLLFVVRRFFLLKLLSLFDADTGASAVYPYRHQFFTAAVSFRVPSPLSPPHRFYLFTYPWMLSLSADSSPPHPSYRFSLPPVIFHCPFSPPHFYFYPISVANSLPFF